MQDLEPGADLSLTVPWPSRQPPAMAGRVLRLAWPVLLQQLLVFAVGLSDRFLAGRFEPPGGESLVAYQAAQTNANYLAWFISSYTVLVSTGSTALVARFVGARDYKLAVRTTN